VKSLGRQLVWLLAAILLIVGCSSSPATGWVEDDVTFVADGLSIHGTYRHERDAKAGPAALIISESGNTDRNGDNAVAGPVGNMRQLAEHLSDKGIASLRYDKVGTGKTGLGPYALHPTEVGSAVYTSGARAAIRYLAQQPGTEKSAVSTYAVGEGGVHAMALATDTAPDAPKIQSLVLLQPLSGRYLDIISGRVRAGVNADVTAGAKTRQQADDVIATWAAAVAQIRTTGTAPGKLPEGLSGMVNPGNVKAVAEADAIDPLALASKVPAGMPVLLTCSDSDTQATCDQEKPLIDALQHTALTVVRLDGVNHVLRHDPTDNVGNYSKQDPLSPQLLTALDAFIAKLATPSS
jgi:alpha-beta hydrolase superfamily lysophospholipase